MENQKAGQLLSAETVRQDCGQIMAIIRNIESVIRGKGTQVSLCVLCLLAEGHVLIEDIPGVGKTSLVSALARTPSTPWAPTSCPRPRSTGSWSSCPWATPATRTR